MITGVITDGTTGVVRAGSAAVRRAQTGFLRYYAALMIVCLAGVALYFLISSTMTLSILIWLPLAISVIAAILPRARDRAGGRGRQPRHDRRRDLVRRAVQARPRRPSVRHRRRVDLRARDPLQARPRRAERRAGAAHDRAVQRIDVVVLVPRVGSRRQLLLPLRARRERRARRVLRPGPGAVRRVLRPDADPVLLHGRDVGLGRAGAGDDQARDLHAGRVVLHARGRGRHRRARPRIRPGGR